MKPTLRFLLLLLSPGLLAQENSHQAEVIRDQWGVPHIFAANEAAGFFGAGYAAAEDRLLQMELFRRRSTGRLAEVFGPRWVESDRKFRIAGMAQHCAESAAGLPESLRAYLQSYAAGVNAWVTAHPERVTRRLSPLGIPFAPWTEGDCVCAWMAVGEIFDALVDESAVRSYIDFRQLAAEVGERAALAAPGMMIDDAAAVVPESEMAKNPQVYRRLKSMPRQPGYWQRSLPDEMLRFSHAWAVGGSRSATGKPILESDPQTMVNNPPLWYEYHLSAGRFDVRGIAVAGSPGMLIGFSRTAAWGASALGAGSVVTFVEKLAAGGRGYQNRDGVETFDRRLETIAVKDGIPVVQEVLRTRHGFVVNALINVGRSDEAYVSYYPPIQDKSTSVLGLLQMMGAGNWHQFRDAMQYYYSPGLHVVFADAEGTLAYQTLLYQPLTRRTRRMALEGWTGEDEITGRIPLDELPNMTNPEAGFISHANNLPAGSWYPYDLGIATGGIGHSARSMRLIDLLNDTRIHTVQSFESEIHRDDVHSAVTALLPAARRVAEQTLAGNRSVQALLSALDRWDFRYRASQPSYLAAQALAGNLLPAFRRSGLGSRVGGGEGGISHLARLVREQYGSNDSAPVDAEVRDYLTAWLTAAAAAYTPGRSNEILRMPYQANGPMGFPSLDSRLDAASPPLSCTQISTIWSQTGNSYTQIVDLSDIDNSRTLLPPGVSEDPESPFHLNQMELWAAGGTHPSPLSRERVEAIAVSRETLEVQAYSVSSRPPARRTAWARPGIVLPAIPQRGR